MSKSLADYLSDVRRAIPIAARTGDAQANTTTPITDKVDLNTYRPIHPDESAVIIALLKRSDPEAQAFLSQLDGMMVSPNCTCGCPSFSIAIADHHERTNMRRNIVADLLGELSDGTVGLILWQAGGKLSGLEVYDLAGRDGPYGLPKPDTLYTFEGTSKLSQTP